MKKTIDVELLIATLEKRIVLAAEFRDTHDDLEQKNVWTIRMVQLTEIVNLVKSLSGDEE